MSSLILPDVVLHNLELERSMDRVERLRQRGHDLQSIERDLQDIDPMLSLVRAREQVENPEMRPGFWHVRRCNAPFPDSYITIEGPDGQFVEPHSGVVEWFRREDTRRQGYFDDLRKAKERGKREQAIRRAEFHADQRVELAERIKAYANPGVSFAGTGRGWSYRAGAKRAA